MNEVGETVIDSLNENVKIIVNTSCDQYFLPIDRFEWRKEGDTLQLTLNEIAEQYIKLGARSETDNVLYVWTELGLGGTIYQYNNYSDGKWYEHGTTKGYA